MLSVLTKINLNVLDAHRTFLETRNDYAEPSRPVSQTQLKPNQLNSINGVVRNKRKQVVKLLTIKTQSFFT